MWNDDKNSDELRNAATLFGTTLQSYKIGKEVEIAKLIKETQNALFLHSYQTPACFRAERPIIDYSLISIFIRPLFLWRKEHDFMALCTCMCVFV